LQQNNIDFKTISYIDNSFLHCPKYHYYRCYINYRVKWYRSSGRRYIIMLESLWYHSPCGRVWLWIDPVPILSLVVDKQTTNVRNITVIIRGYIRDLQRILTEFVRSNC